jgi:hypothetical protein
MEYRKKPREEMVNIRIHTNDVLNRLLGEECLKCGIVNRKMRRIGPFVMCSPCTHEEWPYSSCIEKPKQDKKYQEWLKKYTEQYS